MNRHRISPNEPEYEIKTKQKLNRKNTNMATRDDMIVSNYIQKSDLPQPTRLTVSGCSRKNVGNDEKPEYKWVVEFEGAWKPLILNYTNTDAFFDTLDANSDNWAGKQIVLYNDKSVEYKGKKGGIRVYQQMEVVDAQAPPSQFTPDNNLVPQSDQQPPPEDTTDYSRKPPVDNVPY